MGRKKVAAGLVGLLVLVGWSACVRADVAATVNPGDVTWQNAAGGVSVGWRFFVDKEIYVTHLGVLDLDGDGLTTTHHVGIWRLPKTGGFDLKREVTIGPGIAPEADGHVYVDIEDLHIIPDPVPYILNGVEYYERWLIGVWSPSGNADAFIVQPRSAAVLNIEQAGIIRFQNYTSRSVPTYPGVAPYYWTPWGTVSEVDYFAVNFKYEQPTPVAEAGPDVTIYSSEQALTVVAGTAVDPYPGPESLTYRWLEGETVLQDWAAVGAEDAAYLNLAPPVSSLALGAHILTLEVTDGAFTVSDTMALTVENTPPEAQPAPTSQVVELNIDAILLQAEVADFDGDTVTYQWFKGIEELASGTVLPPAGGSVVSIPDLVIPAGDSRFPLGSNEVQLVVNDGVNPAVTMTATIEVKDTTAPTLAPTSSVCLLWPPNHALCPITVWANSQDNSGGLITLSVEIQSSEAAAPGEQDWYIDSVDDETGVIALQLRAERAGTDAGRVYTIAITATDPSTNTSTVATVEVRVPHDRRKK